MSNDDRPETFVFFVEGRTDFSFRLIRRRPQAIRTALFSNVARFLTGSSITHCAIGLPPYTLDSNFDGSNVYDFEQWLNAQTRMCGWFAVKADKWPDYPWGLVTGNQRRSTVLYEARRLTHWATRGIVPCEDCVALVKRGLSACGVDLPRNIVSAAAMWKWFNARGHRFNPCDHRTVSGLAPENGAPGS